VGRSAATVLVLAALALGCVPGDAAAHAGLTSSDPAAGAALGAAPTAVVLTFSEQPQASLSSITVSDTKGVAYQAGLPQPARGDPLSLVVPVRALGSGVYTVSWRVDSAVDGHATSGAYAFGVGVSPSAVPATRSTTQSVSSLLELLARWVLLVGLVALLGAATAGAARFGGERGTDLVMAAAGWLAAVIGLLLLAEAQRRNASSSFGALLRTPVGHALIWRAVALGAAGAALLLARQLPRIRRGALLAAMIAALAAIAVHVANGHADAGSWPHSLTVAAQFAHFAAAGVWIGGLGALLLGVRGAPSPAKTAAVRRFSTIAAVGLSVVVATGTVRAFSALHSWGDLTSTGYGRAVLAKIVLVAIIAVLGLRNRRRSVPAAAANLRPLRRTSAVELTVAAGALAVAALLGTLAPPVAGQQLGLRGLSVTGADLATTVRVRLTTVSDEPGPNRFVAHVQDYDTGAPVRDANVQLSFTPLDDPGVAATSLGLRSAGDGSYAGSGANLTFDGRWGVTVLIQRASGAVEVPLELDVPSPPEQESIERIPGEDPKYTNLDGNLAFVRISPHPERAGPSQLYVTLFTVALGDEARVNQLVLTAAAGNGPTQQQPVRRLGTGSFVADVTLASGSNTIVVVARLSDDTRIRSSFDLSIPAAGH
jgi:copper transport protein